jgi:hypothetical protein
VRPASAVRPAPAHLVARTTNGPPALSRKRRWLELPLIVSLSLACSSCLGPGRDADFRYRGAPESRYRPPTEAEIHNTAEALRDRARRVFERLHSIAEAHPEAVAEGQKYRDCALTTCETEADRDPSLPSLLSRIDARLAWLRPDAAPLTDDEIIRRAKRVDEAEDLEAKAMDLLNRRAAEKARARERAGSPP